MAIIRVVRPELLDALPPDNPAARRSRADLRAINFLMGNFRWIRRMVARHAPAARLGVVEIGAGEGHLARHLLRGLPGLQVTGIDLAPAPPGLPERLRWKQGDLFHHLPRSRGGVVVGSMIAHHFDDSQLWQLGEALERFEVICLTEPWRDASARLLGRSMCPLVGKVTRHDMLLSIDAGFRLGELRGLLGLRKWRIQESTDWRGALRFVAWKE